MPHDKNGQALSEGDEIIIRGRVLKINPGEEYCNLDALIEPMPPYTEPYKLVLNTRQVEKVGRAEVSG